MQSVFHVAEATFHHKIIYTMDQLHDNLNKNYGLDIIEIKGNQFFDIDNILEVL